MTVRILDEALINKIAAGEVVERPASVVKELVENALDAGAANIEVELKTGGRTLIRIVDDGRGMGRDDALMALERHATSKIRSMEDLIAVSTLGFRGEALPSIASVSRFQLVSRPTGEEVGTSIRVEGGELRDVVDAGCAPGTEIDVRSLFFNLPVRRKFLRTPQTELGHCLETVVRQALMRPDVSFRVSHDGREALHVPVVADRSRRARDLLGEHGGALVEVDFDEGGFAVSGLVSPVGVHRGARSGASYLYVNGRFVRDPVLRRAVSEAYRGIVPKGRYPVVVLSVRLAPERVDVNVHPTKIEVRFRDPRDLVATVSRGLRHALASHGIHRPVERAGPGNSPERSRIDGGPSLPAHPADDPRFTEEVPAPPPSWAPYADLPTTQTPWWVEEGEADPAAPSSALLPVPRYRDLRVIGQLDRTYILCEGGGELVVIDQHAAHEGVMLHELKQDARSRLGGAQRLLTPRMVALPRQRAALLAEHLDVLEGVLLEVQPFDATRFAVTAVPDLLDGIDLERLLTDVADELASDGGVTSPDDVLERVLATMACHSAVRAHDALTDYEMRALLAALDEVDFEVCAHGRPVAVRITAAELAHRFHRT